MKSLLTIVAVVAITTAAHAHDFWIEPSTFRPAEGQTVAIHLRVGENFEGEPIARNSAMIEAFTIRDRDGERPIAGVDRRDPAGYLKLDRESGIVAYRGKPRLLTIKAAALEQFLREERIEGVKPKPASLHREHFSRFSKALLSRPGSNRADFSKPYGWRFEIVPQTDAADGTFRALVLLEGKPAPNAPITALQRGTSVRIERRTDAQGRVAIDLPDRGVWLVKSTAMLPVHGGEAEWETLWASVTFER